MTKEGRESGVPRRNLTETVIAGLRQRIGSGALRPGDRLPTEPALAAEFGVSRTVIREAVANLRADGLLDSRHGVGVFVQAPSTGGDLLRLPPVAATSISEVIEELELRSAVEIEAAGLAAQRASPGQEAEILAHFRRLADLVHEGAETAEADFAFHVAIARATNNRRFEGFLSQLGRRTIPRERLREAIGRAMPDREAELLAEHRDVAEAIGQHNPAAAREAMRAHLLGSLERYRALARELVLPGAGG